MSKNHHPRGASVLAGAVRELYAAGQTDYSLDPIVLVDALGNPIGRIADGDVVIFCCRRGEREIELTEAFTEAGFGHFQRNYLQNLNFIILTLYHEKLKDLSIAFAPVKIKETLSEAVSRQGLRQLHVSESEKFSHITFFLNGGTNEPFPGEKDMCIPSPKGVPFDKIPELSLQQVVDQVQLGLEEKFDLIITNFANGDVIGHTSNNAAKIHCASLVDLRLGQVMDAARRAGYVTLITADHGNLEEMTNQDGTPNVAHTTNLVPFFLVDPSWSTTVCTCDGSLANLAPTVLSALGIDPPVTMTSQPLCPDYNWGGKRRVLLIILDGWGFGKTDETNPIFLASTPVWDDLCKNYPYSKLKASGEEVGLKPEKAGNSEAGHMNIGAGRVILQDDVRLDRAMQDGSFYTNEVFLHAMDDVKRRGAKLHLLGLLSEKSSHGSIDYPLALLKMAKEQGVKNVFLHVIFDGRSTEPGSAPVLLEKLEKQVDEIGLGKVVTGVGRAYALDRDHNYAKIKRAYEALVAGAGKKCVLDE